MGFLSGQVEVRKHLSGEVIHQTKMEEDSAIANIFFYDYRSNGQNQVIIVTTSGLIKGFTLTQNLKQYDLSQDAAAKEDSEQ